MLEKTHPKNPQNRGGKVDRDEKGRFVEGREKTGGRRPGIKNFATIFEKAIRKIAKELNLKKREIEIDLVLKAILEAKGGNYQYYKDIFDRLYGKARETIEHSGALDQNITYRIIDAQEGK